MLFSSVFCLLVSFTISVICACTIVKILNFIIFGGFFMDNISNLRGWTVDRLDLPFLIECLNQHMKHLILNLFILILAVLLPILSVLGFLKMTKIEILVACVSFVVCVLHVIVDFVIARKNCRKLDRLCNKCGLPVYDDIEHKCPLSDQQLNALYDFVVSVRGDDNGTKH